MLLQNKSVKPRWHRKRALLILKKEKYINKRNLKRINPCRNIQAETSNKIKTQQILCHEKIKTRCGHLSATDYLGSAFPKQRYLK